MTLDQKLRICVCRNSFCKFMKRLLCFVVMFWHPMLIFFGMLRKKKMKLKKIRVKNLAVSYMKLLHPLLL